MNISIFLSLLLALTGCVHPSQNESNAVYSFKDMPNSITKIDEKQDPYNMPGPFPVKVVINQILTLAPMDQVTTDMFIPDQNGSSPLIIIVHGNKFSKETHRSQAEFLASWGFHVLTVSLPNEKQWDRNGFRIKKIVGLLQAVPSLVSPLIDTDKIILVGHSFGGSAVTIAAGMGTKVAGLILLDPAVVSTDIPGYLRDLRQPVVLLGADKKVFISRLRDSFSKNIVAPFFELTVKGATHNDAQMPTLAQNSFLGLDLTATKQYQMTFKRLILKTAISMTEDRIDKIHDLMLREQSSGNITILSNRLDAKPSDANTQFDINTQKNL